MLDRLAGIVRTFRSQGLRSPESLLLLMGAAVPLSFAVWQALLNNFAIEKAAFTGAEIGILQSLREVPGFLAFTAVFVLLLLREQPFALLSIALLGIGTAATGFFPTVIGLYLTTIVMSVGYHYNETIQQSLALQWVGKERAPLVLGRVIAAASFTSLIAYGLMWAAFDFFDANYTAVYLIGGGGSVAIAVFAWFFYPQFPAKVEQHKKLIFRQRYWLYYGLTFLSGARRQIFIVFAGFMMVEKFGYSVANITLLFLINYAANIWLAPAIGRLIQRWGERKALTLEYIGLIVVFTSYAFVTDPTIAAGLYVIDHLFFAMAIAIKTYFQKIADPRDIAPTAAVSFTINHIAAVVLPVLLGYVWLVSPSAVFLVGTGFAVGSLLLTQLIPMDPQAGQETVLTRRGGVQPAE
ncbi:MFS transporter [Limibacillus halophilus]|uniref:Putative MFS family arabinose efflux permease n=1 Tax=Limibacillus halophilus TaxID=1579333 RepID=A0A839SS91_9PROT|nr:MFS transporter [Limibacillus halophilus]MBB3065188.1 putative MFS family arabinose efflux permease [Limibacillus halophilus]